MTDGEIFHSWQDYKSWLPGRTPGRLIGKSVFRGQADADWPVISNFDRSYLGEDQEREIRYQKFLTFFRYLNKRIGNDMSDDRIEIAALAQHYGVPTRLIDWSLSPYVAAFFAFYYYKINRLDCPYVAIWEIECDEFARHIRTEDFYLVNSSGIQNYRVHRQYGKFVVASGNFGDLTDYVKDRQPKDGMFRRHIIAGDVADEALNDLIFMGITPADIYPDFYGIAQYIKLRMAFEGYKL